MAIFRKVHVSFWSDSFVSELDKDKKLFYIYLLTNEKTTQCGIYEITKKQISFDLGYSIDTVSKLILYFTKVGKIRYNEQTHEMAIHKWVKYNSSSSPKVKSCIERELSNVKDTLLIEYINSIDTLSQEEKEEEEEQEKEEEKKKEMYIPEFPEFKSYALENKANIDCKELELKYKAWKENDWKDGYNKPIKKWKSKLLQTIPYIKTVEISKPLLPRL